MNPVEFYRPVAELVDLRRLQRRRVAVIGLGSGGCRVAAELGRLGVQLLLVERPEERLQEHNIVRHLLGFHSLGRLKLSETARYIHNLNPDVRIETCGLDVVEEADKLEQRLTKWRPDLLAVCTDNEPSKHALNALALRLGVAQTGGAVYDGGIGGEVYRVRPGQACYGCLATHLQLERQYPQSSPDYGPPGPDPAPTTSALNLDIAQIALLHCRVSLDVLLEPESNLSGLPPRVNLCVFANRIVPGTFARPWHAEFFHVARRRDCLECSPRPGDFEGEADKILTTLQAPPHRHSSRSP